MSNPLQDALDTALRENHELRRENLALQAQVAEWQAVGRELVREFDFYHGTEQGGKSFYSMVGGFHYGGSTLRQYASFDESKEHMVSVCAAIRRLLSLVNSTK